MNENIINIVGTLGKDPDLRYTTGGRGVASFSVATNRSWKNKTTDEWEQETTWFNVVVWADLGEHVAQSLSKGDRVMVSGRLVTRTYETREGEKKYITEIIADHVGAELRFANVTVEKVERNGPSDRAADRTVGVTREPVYGEEEPF